MKAIVTGACGFVGPHLISHLKSSGDEVLGIVRDSAGEVPFETLEMDLLNESAFADVVEKYRPDCIYHLAGLSFVPEAERNFELALQSNVLTCESVLQAASRLKNTTVLYVSSAAVYGNVSSEELPVTETTPANLLNNYSLSKFAAELVCRKYEHRGSRVVVARPFNHIGRGQSSRFAISDFARQVVKIASKQQPPVLKVGNLDVARDFTNVRDIVRGYRLAVLSGNGTYNFCVGTPAKLKDVVQSLADLAGVQISLEVEEDRFRAVDNPVVYGSYDKAKSELGWRPEIPLEESLKEILEYWNEFQSDL